MCEDEVSGTARRVKTVKVAELNRYQFAERAKLYKEMNQKLIFLIMQKCDVGKNELAAFLGISYSTMIEWINKGEMICKLEQLHLQKKEDAAKLS